MTVSSGFYVVTAHLGGWFVRFGAWLAGVPRSEPESSPLGNFSPVMADPLALAIHYGFAGASADNHALPEIRDAVLDTHHVVWRKQMPDVVVMNNYACAGGASRHMHTEARAVWREAVALLAIAEHLDKQ